MLIIILNIYNPLNNIKFTKEKKSKKKNYPVLDSIQKEKERKKINQSIGHNLNTNYNLKYL